MRKMLLKGLMVVAAMLVCLSASAIDKVVKSTGLDNEVTSLEELKAQKVILQNAEGQMLYIPGVGGETSWDFKMTDLVNGLTSNNGAFLSAIDYDGHLIFQVFNLNGDERATPGWAGGKAYLNTQPEGKNVIFGLAGMNDQHGQDGPNLAVWDVEYVEGQGFSFHNVGRDIYLGYDATDARPSTSVVYWKAFTAYHAGYVQTEVEAAYEQAIAAARTTETIAALEAAKSTFDSSADLNAFGDVVNASIDVINACQAVNAEYANLDEAGAAVAKDVLAKYENKEYANIAELRAAYILAAKAQTTAGANMTGAIVNPEINGADGWTIEKLFGGNGPLLGETSFEYWAGNASDRSKASFDYYQIITGLPNGAYTVTADMYNSLNGEAGATWNATSGVYGKGANESVTLVNEDGATLKPYTTGQVFVVDGTIRIGVKNTITPMAARWFVADNFKLTYLGETREYAEATKPYAIAIAEGIENGTVAADLETAIAGATVTLTATPAEGYKLESISVMAGETPVEVSEEGTFVMPAAAVIISAVFAAEAVEPEPTPVAETFTATLVHTASSTRGNTADIVNTVDADKEHVNNTNFNNVWAASAYAEFSLADLPNGATITKATLSYTGIGSGKNRNTDVLYVNAGETIDYESMPTSGTAVGLGATLIETVTFPANATTPFTADVTDALKAILASQNYIIIKWTNNVGGGDIAGKASENAPQLVVEYMPGAPEIANASFEADGEKAASNSPLTLTGWTFDGVGSEYNNTEIRPAGSTSTTSAFGTSAPSDGEYSLFFRQGWNGTGNTITITSDALTAIPAGDYTLSVDYKQQYAYDNTQNSNTKVGIALVNGETTIASEISPAAEAGGSATYFNETKWNTLTASFTVDKAVAAGAKVVITLYSAGQKRSDFFIDNVQLVKVPGVELALIDLNKAIETAKAETGKYIVGDGLFQYPASQIEPLTSAIATAESAYAAAESKETVVAATDALNAALASFAPVATLPAADKQYTLSLKTTDEASPFDLSIAQAGITIAEVGTPVSFVAQEDGSFALSNGTEYVVYSGANTWTLAASADPYGWTIAAVEGGYTITGKNGFLGTNTKDGSAAGSTCYGDKKSSNGFYIWTISEYVAPAPTFAIAIAEGIENGTIAADVETAEEGATVTLTATPAEGYKLEAITVKAGEASVKVTEAEGTYTFVMPAAAVTVSATFVAEAIEPEPVDPNLIEIAQSQGKDLDDFARTELVEGEEYNTYTANADLQIAMKMMNIDVADCDYIVIKFAEEVAAGWKLGVYNGTGLLDIPEGVKEFKYVFADDSKCEVTDGVLPQICMMTFFGGYTAPLVAKVEGVYKHKVASEPVEPTTYAIAIAEGIENGTIAADVETAAEGATVTLTATPAEGYKLVDITVKAGDASVEVTEAEGAYTFAMPAAAVTVSATFVAETIELEVAKVENMTLTVAKDAVISDKDKTFPVVFGYTATVDEAIAAMASGWISYTVTAEGKEPINGEIDFDVDKDARNIPIPGLDNETDYTITINSVSVSYFDLETYESQVAFEKKFKAGELKASFNTGVPVGINGVAAGVKANRKVVENGRVVIYKNGVKTMSSGVSIR